MSSLGHLHQTGFVHKDIKPANILLNRETGHVWLTGFGITSRQSRERQTPAPPELIAGTLEYIAPEQTGRLNRAVDTRADLYSCGMVFYEVLTAPFHFQLRIRWSGFIVTWQDILVRPENSQITFRQRFQISS